MSIDPGSRFGPYEILSTLGAGGMGEVYRARDTTLGRDVALKILPAVFAGDPDRVARFRREAHLLASLNHPHIGAIYGLEESQGVPVLVLELVEGATLAERLTHGRIPPDEALPMARQIADALEAAHEQGVVHRDLKPANIKLRPDGTVKVLDFGLAKAMDPVSGPDVAVAATVTSPAMTRIGVILGTAAYMSPEQARGQAVDRGADIWAFGAVLFEMLAAIRPFAGEDVSQTVAAILRDEPDWSRLPADTPQSLRRVIRRCLEKDRKRRLADIRDARIEIEDQLRGTTDQPAAARVESRRRERVLWSAALLIFAIIAAGSIFRRSPGTASTAGEMTVEITTPPTVDPVSFALSPDGQKIAFVASSEGRSQLWVRSLDSPVPRVLRGTDGATFPFWSPDSRSIGFFASEKLRRVDLEGGVPKVLGPGTVGNGGTWNRDGVILYTVVPDAPLMRISDGGGRPTPLPGFEQRGTGSGGQRFPQFLPDGRHFIYHVAESRGVYLGVLDGSERRRVLDADAAAVFVPPAELLFVRERKLYAQRFDLQRLELTGQPIRVADNIAVSSFGVAAVSAAATGSIVYRTGASGQQRSLILFDRSSKELRRIGEPDNFNPANPSFSNDERHVALSRSVDGNTDIWVLELGRDVMRKVTFDPLPEIVPAWSPDGSRILYSKPIEGGSFALHQKPIGGDGKETVLFGGAGPIPAIAMDWSRDGRFVLYRGGNSDTGWDIWALPMRSEVSDGKPIPVAQTRFDERAAQFSGDGKWIAFESNESGHFEIQVQPFPGPGTKVPVSTAGGSQPRWRADGRELFYVAPDSYLMSVAVRPSSDGTSLEFGSPVRLFAARVNSSVQGGIAHEYAVSRDGKQFLMNTYTEQSTLPVTLILNRNRRAN